MKLRKLVSSIAPEVWLAHLRKTVVKVMSGDREGLHRGQQGQSQFRSLGQAEAYPTKSPAFQMWGKLQLARPGDSPALACGPPKAMKPSLRCSSTEPAMFFNRGRASDANR
jgi:hypothetical protein